MAFSSRRCIRAAVILVLAAGCALPERPETGGGSSPRRVLEDPAAGGFARAEAIRQLGASKPGNIVSLIIRHVDDPAAIVRLQVAEALGSSGDPAAAPGLERLLEDDDRNVRRAAALGLFRRGIYRKLYQADPQTALERVRRLLLHGNAERFRVLAKNTCSEVEFEETALPVEAARFVRSLPDADFLLRAEAERVLAGYDLSLKRFSAG